MEAKTIPEMTEDKTVVGIERGVAETSEKSVPPTRTTEFVMKDLWLIRHAQSEQNAYGEILSPEQLRNAKLSPLGREQAATLERHVELLVISPLRRSLETYVFSGLKVKRLMVAECIREVVDNPASELDLEKWGRQETKEEVEKRLEETIQLIASQPEKEITLLSHICFLKALSDKLGIKAGLLANAQVLHCPGVKIPKKV